jgi:lipoyl synthase
VSDARHSADPAPGPGRRKPDWLKVKAPAPRQYRATEDLIDELALHTVCREARCPNKGECYASGTAAFLILGDVCTRGCRFCAVEHQRTPGSSGVAEGDEASPRMAGLCSVDPDEPARVAAAALRLGLRHVVVTSVTRDDLPDGGAAHFAAAVAAVRAALPSATVEVLIPDLGGDEAALAAVLAARPDVLNHNLETVPRLYAVVRPQAEYARSLELLRRAARWTRVGRGSDEASPGRSLVKSGLMVGLGESADEVDAALTDCAAAGVDLVTVGQYLQPDAACLPVARYVPPVEFARIAHAGAALGLRVTAAPFVRSSYKAGRDLEGGAVDRGDTGGGGRGAADGTS